MSFIVTKEGELARWPTVFLLSIGTHAKALLGPKVYMRQKPRVKLLFIYSFKQVFKETHM